MCVCVCTARASRQANEKIVLIPTRAEVAASRMLAKRARDDKAGGGRGGGGRRPRPCTPTGWCGGLVAAARAVRAVRKCLVLRYPSLPQPPRHIPVAPTPSLPSGRPAVLSLTPSRSAPLRRRLAASSARGSRHRLPARAPPARARFAEAPSLVRAPFRLAARAEPSLSFAFCALAAAALLALAAPQPLDQLHLAHVQGKCTAQRPTPPSIAELHEVNGGFRRRTAAANFSKPSFPPGRGSRVPAEYS